VSLLRRDLLGSELSVPPDTEVDLEALEFRSVSCLLDVDVLDLACLRRGEQEVSAVVALKMGPPTIETNERRSKERPSGVGG
jgi:hypothetical protein